MGTVVGAIAAGEVPAAGRRRPDRRAGPASCRCPWASSSCCSPPTRPRSSWCATPVRPATSELAGLLRAPRAGAAVIAGAAAVARGHRAPSDARYVYDGLTSWPGIALVVLSGHLRSGGPWAAGHGADRGLRVAAVGAGVASIWGYFAAAFPYMLPTSLTISDAAGASPTLALGDRDLRVAAVTVVPSLILLYALSQRKTLEATRPARPAHHPTHEVEAGWPQRRRRGSARRGWVGCGRAEACRSRSAGWAAGASARSSSLVIVYLLFIKGGGGGGGSTCRHPAAPSRRCRRAGRDRLGPRQPERGEGEAVRHVRASTMRRASGASSSRPPASRISAPS